MKWAGDRILTRLGWIPLGLLSTTLATAEPMSTSRASDSPSPSTPVAETSNKGAGDTDPSLEDLFEKKRFSLNVKNAEIREVLRIIADRGSLDLKFDSSITGKVNLSLQEVTLGEALDRIAEDHGLEYLIDGGRLAVKRPEKR